MNPEYVEWEENGKHYRQVSATFKRNLLYEYASRYSLETFVETGTCEGDTLQFLRWYFSDLYSIELDSERFTKAGERFAEDESIHIIHGDSGVELPRILPLLEGKVLFWLDAHGPNWIGPVVKEVQAIYDYGIKGVILIDDMDYITDTIPSDQRWIQEKTEYGIARFIHVD